MKATGIVRRIDDLGRVVIPKEIRRTMRIREGDPLEIFTERGGEVIFKKYSPIGELGEFAANYAEALAKTSGNGVVISDKDSVIAVSGASKKELADKKISSDVEKSIESKHIFTAAPSENNIPVVDGADKYFAGVVAPIISEGDTIGSVMMVSDKQRQTPSELEVKLCQSAALFLGRHMEVN